MLMSLSHSVWTWYRGDYRYDVVDLPEDEQNYSVLHCFLRYVLREVHLILVYVCVAFVFTSLMCDRIVDRITIARWCIEAAWTPHIFVTLIGTYLDLFYHHLIDFDFPYATTRIYLVKGTLFVWMRYAEWNPSSELNDFQTVFFYEFCNELGLHRVPDDHRLCRFMLNPDTSTST